MRYAGYLCLHRSAWLSLLLGLAGCVEPYVPAVLDAPTSYLVVDGFLNGNGVTTILLSRTASLAAATPPVEKSAQVFIVDDTGRHYPLAERASGTYQSDSLVFSSARQYQLRFTTSSAAAYTSDLVPLKLTPPIDKLGWQLDGNNVQVTISTHDPQQQSRYYRWGFVETWEFHSAFESIIEYSATQQQIVHRTTPIYTCWQMQRSSTIQQGSSAQLSQDALTNVPLLAISSRAERLSVRYSVLVSQYAETAAEFAYYDLLRKNTEAVGTVNDPLPTQLTGNVHRVNNATEPVLGYVGAHTVQLQRLFIDRQDLPLPRTWIFDSPYQQCKLDTVTKTLVMVDPDVVPVAYRLGETYFGTSRECADCRLRGSNVKPSFW